MTAYIIHTIYTYTHLFYNIMSYTYIVSEPKSNESFAFMPHDICDKLEMFKLYIFPPFSCLSLYSSHVYICKYWYSNVCVQIK